MRFGMFRSGLDTFGTPSGKRPAKQALRRAAQQALSENLEKRRFLSVTNGYTGLRCRTGLPGTVLSESLPTTSTLHLGSPSPPVAAELFGSTTASSTAWKLEVFA